MQADGPVDLRIIQTDRPLRVTIVSRMITYIQVWSFDKSQKGEQTVWTRQRTLWEPAMI
jgi:hypothetical protein